MNPRPPLHCRRAREDNARRHADTVSSLQMLSEAQVKEKVCSNAVLPTMPLVKPVDSAMMLDGDVGGLDYGAEQAAGGHVARDLRRQTRNHSDAHCPHVSTHTENQGPGQSGYRPVSAQLSGKTCDAVVPALEVDGACWDVGRGYSAEIRYCQLLCLPCCQREGVGCG